MSSVNPVQMSSEALAQILAMAVSKSIEQATNLARLNLELQVGGAGGGASLEGVGEMIDTFA
jgi:hypothetical protein